MVCPVAHPDLPSFVGHVPASPSLPPPSLPRSRPPPQSNTSHPTATSANAPQPSTSAAPAQTFSRPVAPPAKYSTSTYLIPDPLLNRGAHKNLRPRHWGLGRRVIKGVGGGTWGVVNWMGEEEIGTPSLRDRAAAIGGGSIREREREREYQPRPSAMDGSIGGWAGGGGGAVKSEAYLAGLRAATAGVGVVTAPPPVAVATNSSESPAPTPPLAAPYEPQTADVKMEA